MRFRSWTVLACVVSIASASLALAQDPTKDTGGGPSRHFGKRGVLAFSSDTTLLIEHTSTGRTTAMFAPAADVFLIDGLSLGGFIGFEYSKMRDYDGSRFSIGPRVGYNYSFTDLLSIWPKVGLAYAHTSRDFNAADQSFSDGPDTSHDSLALNLFMPIMIHPATHFFAGLGPYLDVDLIGENRVTAYGIKLTLGGWLE